MFRVSTTLRTLFAVMLLALGPPLTGHAEEGEWQILAPWEAKGRVYKVGPGQLQFIGEMQGIMYVDKGDEKLNTAPFVCPFTHELDTTTNQIEVNGRCHIVAAAGNVFAKFTCSGQRGSCDGTFELTGGTARFEGITGSSDMNVRTALNTIMIDAASGKTVAEVAGLALFPNLKYKRPDIKAE